MLNSLSDYLVNSLIDQVLREQTPIAPATVYVALTVANQGEWVASTVYPAASYMTVMTSDGTYHLYYSAAGGTGSGTPVFYGVPGESISDGTITWVEQTANIKSGAAINEPMIGSGSYGRIGVTSALVNWAGTQGSGSITASTGTSGETSNNNGVVFPTPTGSWAATPAVVWGLALYDAANGGNLLMAGPVTNPQSVTAASSAPSFAAAAITLSLL